MSNHTPSRGASCTRSTSDVGLSGCELALVERYVNRPETEEELVALRRSVPRGSPYGEADWQKRGAVPLKLESSLRDSRCPKKARKPEK